MQYFHLKAGLERIAKREATGEQGIEEYAQSPHILGWMGMCVREQNLGRGIRQRAWLR